MHLSAKVILKQKCNPETCIEVKHFFLIWHIRKMEFITSYVICMSSVYQRV